MCELVPLQKGEGFFCEECSEFVEEPCNDYEEDIEDDDDSNW